MKFTPWEEMMELTPEEEAALEALIESKSNLFKNVPEQIMAAYHARERKKTLDALDHYISTKLVRVGTSGKERWGVYQWQRDGVNVGSSPFIDAEGNSIKPEAVRLLPSFRRGLGERRKAPSS